MRSRPSGQREIPEPGERPAFEPFFRATFPRTVWVVHQMVRDRGTAEDLAVEAYTRAHARWRKVSRFEDPAAWVLRVALNMAIDTWRVRSSRERAYPAGVSRLVSESDEVDLRVTVAAALAKLPQRQRQVVALQKLADMSVADTARTLDISEPTVKTHLAWALSALRVSLASEATNTGGPS